MRNEAEKTRSLKIAFVVNADHLRHLARVLGKVSKQVEYTVGFSDGTNVRYADVEEVIDQPNSGEHSITSLIAGTPEEKTLDDIRYMPSTGGPGVPSTKVAVGPPPTAYVTLRKSNPSESPSVEYTISGTQGTVVHLAGQLDDWVAFIRQWYSAGRSFEGAGAVFAFTALVAPLVVWGYAFQYLFPTSVRTLSWVKSLVVVLLYIAEYGIFKLFPRGTFAIGRGAGQDRALATLRWTVIVILPLSILAGVIANLMTRHL
jgi:hypothetical protein